MDVGQRSLLGLSLDLMMMMTITMMMVRMSLDPCICPHFNQNHGDLDDDNDDHCDEDNFYNNDDVGEKLPCSLFLKKGN